jgi:hypothetical protein
LNLPGFDLTRGEPLPRPFVLRNFYDSVIKGTGRCDAG